MKFEEVPVRALDLWFAALTICLAIIGAAMIISVSIRP